MAESSSSGLRPPLAAAAADTLLDKALDFGIDYYDVDLRPTITSEARQVIRRHLRTRGQSKEELFFSLAAAVLHQLDHRQTQALIADIGAYHRSGTVDDGLHRSFLSRVEQLSLDHQDYWEWASRRGLPADGGDRQGN